MIFELNFKLTLVAMLQQFIRFKNCTELRKDAYKDTLVDNAKYRKTITRPKEYMQTQMQKI